MQISQAVQDLTDVGTPSSDSRFSCYEIEGQLVPNFATANWETQTYSQEGGGTLLTSIVHQFQTGSLHGMGNQGATQKIVASNRRACANYDLLDTYECGIVLQEAK